VRIDTQEGEHENYFVDLHMAEVVQEEHQRQRHAEDERQRARGAIGKRPLDDALRQSDGNAEQQQVDKG